MDNASATLATSAAPEVTVALEGLSPLEIIQLQTYLSAMPEVSSLRCPDATPRNPDSTYSGAISASSEVFRLIAELHEPLVVAGAAGTGALSGFAAKFGAGLGEMVVQWFKEKFAGKGNEEVKATLYGPDGTVIKTITKTR